MNTETVFRALNEELKLKKLHRELIICGGAALIALRIVQRGTQDVDVLKPKIDLELNHAAVQVGERYQLPKNWLNNGPAMLVNELPEDWESQCQIVYSGSNLVVKAIGRRDLIYSKLYAAADRIDDIDDLVALNPSETEIIEARDLVLQQDASEFWPQIVEECLVQLRKRLKNVK